MKLCILTLFPRCVRFAKHLHKATSAFVFLNFYRLKPDNGSVSQNREEAEGMVVTEGVANT